MLSFQVSGLALIDELQIDFSSGLNVITGETGAGKSILIKALSFVFGSRVSSSIIRKGHDFASVTSSFVVHSDHSALNFLENLGIDTSDNEIIVRRRLSSKNRSQFWVNDQATSMSSVKTLGQLLIDILGQHENQGLLNESKHVDYLDQAHPVIRQRVSSKYQAAIQKYNDILKVSDSFANKLRDLDYIQFRIDEISKLEPSSEDFEALESKIRESVSSKKIVTELLTAKSVADYDPNSLSNRFRELMTSLLIIEEQVGDDEVKALVELANTAQSHIDEISFKLEKLYSKYEMESDLDSLEARMSDYYELFRKLSVNGVDGLIEKYEDLKSDVEFVNEAVSKLENMILSLEADLKDLLSDCQRLKNSRLKHSKKICSSIEKELSELNMNGAKIKFEFQEVSSSISSGTLNGLSDSLITSWNESVANISGLSSKGTEKANSC